MEVFQYAESPNSVRMKCGTMFLGELFGRVVGCDMSPDEKRDRLLEAASAVLEHATDNRLNAVCLNKAIFYLDLVSLRDLGHPVTYAPFIALQNGPVVAKYPQRLISQLQDRGIARQISEWDGSKPVLLENCPSHFEYIDADTLLLANAVTSYFAEGTSRQASEYSHENPGWRLAWNQYRRTGKPCAINMRIALQQIVEDDPWLDRPMMNDDEILAAADEACGVDW